MQQGDDIRSKASKGSYRKRNFQLNKFLQVRNSNYALNDFDDNYSVSEADLSMVSGSQRNFRYGAGVPFIETNHTHLEPSSKMMADMAASTVNILAPIQDELPTI